MNRRRMGSRTLLPALLKRVVVVLALLLALPLNAQTTEQGRQALLNKDYEKAHDIFAKVIRQQPNNASVNTWYGQACLETGNLVLAEKHLSFAAKRRVLGAYFHLGRLCIETYRFDQAAENFDLFLEKSKDPAMIAEAEANKDRAERAAALLRGVEQVEVIDSMVVDEATFLSHYRISEEAGRLSDYREFFESKGNPRSCVFETQRRDKIIYGQSSAAKGYDLYTQVKMLDTYGDAKPLSAVVNTEFDENYPFILADGATIYYASNNPDRSIGGYDILVTRYSTSNDAYLTPENVGMPFNSTANDYMMAIDEYHGVGWFASDRYQPEGKVCIYLFIPNSEKRVLDAQSEEERVAYAKLTSIKQTQKRSSYAELLSKVFNSQPTEVKPAADFDFPISDLLVYHFVDEFSSTEAKALFDKYQSAQTKLDTQNAELDKLRAAYAKAEQAQKRALSTQIIALESTIPQQTADVARLAMECRNAEIKHLRK